MHIPEHPLWFWLIAFSPFLILAALWAIARFGGVSLKPCIPWLTAGMILSFPVFVVLGASEGNKAWRAGFGAVFYSCLVGVNMIRSRYRSETLRGPGNWYAPWSSARFSIPQNARILVRNIDFVEPWYLEKLGLRKAVESPSQDADAAAYRFKEDGRSITLTTKETSFGAEKPVILFSKRIGRMQELLSARGIVVGPIERDRQGTRYFEIHDPEGNAIEVVEER